MALSAGQEVGALAWVIQQASPVIARTLEGVPSLDEVVVALPPVEDVPEGAMFAAFARALEHAYTGEAHPAPPDVLPLWALAIALQVRSLPGGGRGPGSSGARVGARGAMEHVYTGEAHPALPDVLPLWALAIALQLRSGPSRGRGSGARARA